MEAKEICRVTACAQSYLVHRAGVGLQVQSEESPIQKPLLAPRVEQQVRVRIVIPTIDGQKCHCRSEEYHRQMMHQMCLQVISDRTYIFPVTQNQEEPSGGTARLSTQIREKAIGGTLKKKAGLTVQKVQKNIHPTNQNHHHPLHQNGTDVQKNTFCT